MRADEPVTFVNGLEIHNGVVKSYTGTARSITIPEGVTEIGEKVFEDRSELEEVIFPSTLVSVGVEAFKRCESLYEVYLPEGVQYVGEGAFQECSELTELTLPRSLLSIGNAAFLECDKLSKLTLHEGLLEIGSFAFSSCEGLKEIRIPRGLIKLGKCAFEDCTSVESIEIGEGLTYLAEAVFENMPELESVKLPDTIRYLGRWAFADCDSLCHIELPDSVERVGASAFKDCCSLESIRLPEGIVELGDSTFEYCENLREVILPESLKRICEEAFCDCRSLESIRLPHGLSYIGAGAFKGCIRLKSIELPKGIEAIEELVFAGCTELSQVKAPMRLKVIERSAFKDCEALKCIYGGEKENEDCTEKSAPYVNIPQFCKVRKGAFTGCRGLTDKSGLFLFRSRLMAFDPSFAKSPIRIPDGVVEIDADIFGEHRVNLVMNEKTPRFEDSVRAAERGFGLFSAHGCTVTLVNSENETTAKLILAFDDTPMPDKKLRASIIYKDGTVDIERYDKVLHVANNEDNRILMTAFRLLYPCRLKEEAFEEYAAYIVKNAVTAGALLTDLELYDELFLLIRRGYIDSSAVRSIAEYTNKKKLTWLTASLLNSIESFGDDTFEL